VKETRHAKEYEARVRFEREPDPARMKELVGRRITVVQRTPERVAHRRADLNRERWVEFLELEPDRAREDGAWRVLLRSEHGTYVKEVLSGEGGKTEPSLADLAGVPCECVELDVLAILDETGASEVAYRSGPPPFASGV
jgi:tRNA pseudouridine synthase 10